VELKPGYLCPPGYKQTEVGVIPEEWEVKSVRDLAQVKTGPFGTLLKAQEYSGSKGVPLISVGEIGSGTFDITEHTPLVPDAVIRRLPQYVLRSGDIVFGRKGAVERSALVTENEDGWFLGSDGISIRPQRMCHPPYLAWQFQRYEVQAWLLQNAIGTTMASLNQGILNRVQIPYAPLPEQRVIATALSDVDALIGALDQLIAKKRDLKQATMLQLLTGQTRLPGFTGKWEMKTLGDLFVFSGGYSASREQLSSKGHCYLHYGDIHKSSKTFIDVRAEYQDIPKLDIPLKRVSPRSLLDDGDVVFVDASEDDEGTSRHVVVLNKEKTSYIAGLHTIVAKSKTDELANEYRRYCFQTAAIRQQFLFYAVGTKVSGISKTNIVKLTLPVPSLPEQAAIAEVLSDMDAELAALMQRRDKTRDLKQGMMQELLTGRTRLV
jgi:type I restriction enzyme, S subunit